MDLLESEAERVGSPKGLIESWDIRTNICDSVAKEWAVEAAAHRCSGSQHVYVVLFFDGDISSVPDPQTGEPGMSDWSYDFIKRASWMLSHGAHLIITAEDAFNPSSVRHVSVAPRQRLPTPLQGLTHGALQLRTPNILTTSGRCPVPECLARSFANSWNR